MLRKATTAENSCLEVSRRVQTLCVDVDDGSVEIKVLIFWSGKYDSQWK
jgi:hypothetical protein